MLQRYFHFGASFFLAVCASVSAEPSKPPAENHAKSVQKSLLTDALTHELWGQTVYGEGYVYGPTNRRSGLTAVDLDTDGDNDFVFPNSAGAPEWMLNLGSAGAFYPGGSRELTAKLPSGLEFDIGLEFGDLNGDTLPDFVAVARSRSPLQKRVVWFKNDGPRDRPTFSYQGVIYTTAQPGLWDGMFLTLGDLDNDNDLDLYVCEAFTDTAVRPHRLFVAQNTGSRTAPQFAVPVEKNELSLLLPPRLETGKVLEDQRKRGLDKVAYQEPDANRKALGYTYNMGDIGFADWDLDGDQDFLFYQRDDGLFWVRNEGTASAPTWANVRGSNGNPLYSHRIADGYDFEEGSFALRTNPQAAKPGAEWLDEIYLSVNNRLKTARYYSDTGYRIVNQSAVAFAFGQGPIAYWDYDYDGDLDLFSTSQGYDPNSFLMGVRNGGTAYTPAWGDEVLSINSVPLNTGNTDNRYREDQYCFADYSGPNTPVLCIQRQDGSIDLYFANAPTTDGGLPSFDPVIDAFPEVVDPSHDARMPAGIAAADFDGDGLLEIVANYQYDDGSFIQGELVVVDLFEDGGDLFYNVYSVPDLLTTLEDETLDPSFIESMAAGDLDLDGRPDLIVTTSQTFDYKQCETFVFRNETFRVTNGSLFYRFEEEGRIDSVYNTDRRYARMPTLGDTDADGDLDLFVSHRFPDEETTGLRKYLRFYRNGGDTGLKYVRFRVVAGREWPLSLRLTTQGGGSVQNVIPTYRVVQNASEGSLLPNAVWRAGNFAPTVDILETTDLRSTYDFPTEVRSYVDVLPPVGANQSKALIVVGDTADGDLYPTFAELAAFAYRVLKSEGLATQSIRLYAATNLDADFDGTNDVTGAPTLSTLQNAVTTWGKSTDKLLVYLIDHGQRDRFRLNGTEFLEASTYDGWLDQIQAGGQGPQVTTLVDTCESGSFLDNIKGPRRINMTSANVGPTEGVSLFDKNEYISFSLNFWLRIYNGDTYGKAFREAKTAIEALNPLQNPQIDDDGDGSGNAANDGLIADDVRPGANFNVRGPTVFIGDIAPNQVLSANSTTLWLSDVTTPFPVEGAKAIIVPPNFTRPSLNNDDEQPVSDLPSVLFSYNSNSGRWEGTYNGFTQGGLYQIQYFVKTGGQYYASPRIGFVDRINRPDAWEEDNTAQTAAWLPINTVQGHNFHQTNDEDWALFNAPAGPATIAVLQPRHNCQPIVDLYRVDDLSTPIRTAASATPGEELVFEQTFPQAGQYILRIRNTNGGLAGAGTSYLLIVAVGTGGSIIPSTLIVGATDSNDALLPGVAVRFDGFSVGQTSNRGIVQVTVGSYDTYEINLDKEGYKSIRRSVSVNNLVEEVYLQMELDDGTEEPKQGGCAACAGTGSDPATLRGDTLLVGLLLALLLATWQRHQLAEAKQRSRR